MSKSPIPGVPVCRTTICLGKQEFNLVVIIPGLACATLGYNLPIQALPRDGSAEWFVSEFRGPGSSRQTSPHLGTA